MVPHLVRWQDEYRKSGLTVLYVENGLRTEKEDAEEEVEDGDMNFPVAWDEEGAVCATYKVKEYPTAFLVGRSGRVLWKGTPSPKKSEERIRKALGIGRT